MASPTQSVLSHQRTASISKVDLGEWEIFMGRKPLGSGSFATVYLGQFKEDHIPKYVAIKSIKCTDQTSSRIIQSINQEGKALTSINHENLVRGYGIRRSNDRFFFIVEYCAGGSLDQWHEMHGDLSEELVRTLFLQLVAGWRYLHERRIVHRDLKPQNILLTDCSENATLKIGDFGLMIKLKDMDMAKSKCGTPLYMAPEVWTQQPYNYKADLWSLGVILYELITRKHPYGNPRTDAALLEAIRNTRPAMPKNASPECINLLQGLLQADPNARFSDTQFFNHPFLTGTTLPVSPSQSGRDHNIALVEQDVWEISGVPREVIANPESSALPPENPPAVEPSSSEIPNLCISVNGDLNFGYLDARTASGQVEYPRHVFDFSEATTDGCTPEQVARLNSIAATMLRAWYILEAAQLQMEVDPPGSMEFRVIALDILQSAIVQLKSFEIRCERAVRMERWSRTCFSQALATAYSVRPNAEKYLIQGQLSWSSTSILSSSVSSSSKTASRAPTSTASTAADCIPVEQKLNAYVSRLENAGCKSAHLRALGILEFLSTTTQDSDEFTNRARAIKKRLGG